MKRRTAALVFCGTSLVASAWMVSRVHHSLNQLDGADLPGGDFTLNSTQGAYSLSQSRGKAVVRYFGYTQCPDVCPLSLQRLSQAMKLLDAKTQDQLQVLFVTVDYKKDTAQKAQSYLEVFQLKGLGLSGNQSQLERVTHQYGASFILEDDPKTAMGYSIQHSIRFFLIDKKGRFQGKLSTDLPLETIARHLEDLI